MWMIMKKSKVNIGIITAFLIISLFNHCKEANVNRNSKIADEIKINAVEVELEDILTPPTEDFTKDLVEYDVVEIHKTR